MNKYFTIEDVRPEAQGPEGQIVKYLSLDHTPPQCGDFSFLSSVDLKLLEMGAGYIDEDGKFRHNNEGMTYKSAEGYNPGSSVATDVLRWGAMDRKMPMVWIWLCARSITSQTGGKMKRDHLEKMISDRIGTSGRTIRKHLMVAHSMGWVKIIRGKYWIQAHDKVCHLMGFDESIRVDLVNNNQDITRASLSTFKSFCYAADVGRSLWSKSLNKMYFSRKSEGTDARLSTKLQETQSDRNGTRTKNVGERSLRLSVEDLGYSLATIHKYKAKAIDEGFIKARKQFCPDVDRLRMKNKGQLWWFLDFHNEGHRNILFDKRKGIYRKREADLLICCVNVRRRSCKSTYFSTIAYNGNIGILKNIAPAGLPSGLL